MTQFNRILCAATVALSLGAGAGLADQIDKANFTLSIRGINAGVLAFSGVERNGDYKVIGRLESTGLAAWLRKVQYDARAQGGIAEGRYTPTRYEEKADTGKRQSESVMEYRLGVPQVKEYNPPRPPRTGDVDPNSQGGTVDPLTALYAVLRDVPLDQACTTSVKMFDGRRASQLTLSPGTTKDDKIICAGEYLRVAGFSEKEMAEKVHFPFRLTYAPAGEGMVRVVEVVLESLYGNAKLKRR